MESTLDSWFLDTFQYEGLGHSEAATTAVEYPEDYGMFGLPLEHLPSAQDSLAASTFCDEIPSMGSTGTSSTTVTESDTSLDSNHVHDSNTSPTTPGARVRQKKRRNTSVSEESEPSLKTSTPAAREKNRLAASKCRRKKKSEEHVLEERRRILQVQHNILENLATDLQNEVVLLKHQVLAHGICDFPPIRNYIKHAAEQLNEGPLDATTSA
ncbi:hypothetical protein SCAR479_11684 [Seiridium cardinale]|uniref:BZIP domain-containing protein n=1 Tax=Seiridium cardinale TaxID=138064 RepID=A0ABR2XCT8_9PEZI